MFNFLPMFSSLRAAIFLMWENILEKNTSTQTSPSIGLSRILSLANEHLSRFIKRTSQLGNVKIGLNVQIVEGISPSIPPSFVDLFTCKIIFSVGLPDSTGTWFSCLVYNQDLNFTEPLTFSSYVRQ